MGIRFGKKRKSWKMAAKNGLLKGILAVSILLLIGVSQGQKAHAENSDPNIFVHGLTGFGHGELGQNLYYWGGTTQNIIGDLSNKGYNSLEAVVS